MFVLTAVIHKEEEMYIAECPEVGTVSQGFTIEEAVVNLKLSVDQKTVLIDDNRVNETVRLDVRSEVGQFLVGHHREQIGDRVDRPLGGLGFGHGRPLRRCFGVSTASA